MMNICNILTILRIVISPVICFFILNKNCLLSFFLFLIASITDFLDGLIARRMNCITNLGKALDPVADKILVFSIMSCFIKFNLINIWAFIILLSRDFIVSIIRLILAKNKIIYEAKISGKIKTLFQFLFIVSTLLLNSLNRSNKIIPNITLWCSVLFSLVSLFLYIFDNKNILKRLLV